MTDSQALELVPEPVNPSVLLERMLFEMRKVIVGQDRAIERMIVCLLANGHCLLRLMPTIVVGGQRHRGVTEFGLAGEFGFRHVGHPDHHGTAQAHP